jgi:hypothetical protein
MSTTRRLLIAGSLLTLSAAAGARTKTERVEDLTFLTPDIALAHVRSELTGDERSPDETFEYRKSALFTRKAGSWRIRALHNTRIRPNAIAAEVR